MIENLVYDILFLKYRTLVVVDNFESNPELVPEIFRKSVSEVFGDFMGYGTLDLLYCHIFVLGCLLSYTRFLMLAGLSSVLFHKRKVYEKLFFRSLVMSEGKHNF